jgi:hypothetical protein
MIRVINTIEVFRVISVSGVYYCFRYTWVVLALLFLIRLKESLGLFRFLELLRV